MPDGCLRIVKSRWLLVLGASATLLSGCGEVPLPSPPKAVSRVEDPTPADLVRQSLLAMGRDPACYDVRWEGASARLSPVCPGGESLVFDMRAGLRWDLSRVRAWQSDVISEALRECRGRGDCKRDEEFVILAIDDRDDDALVEIMPTPLYDALYREKAGSGPSTGHQEIDCARVYVHRKTAKAIRYVDPTGWGKR